MMRWHVSLLVLATCLAPSTAGQGVALTLEVEPARLDVEQGAGGSVELRVRNDGLAPAEVGFNATGAIAFSVRPAIVSIPGGGATTVRAFFNVSPEEPAREVSILFVASDRRAISLDEANATLVLRVGAQAPATTLDPERMPQLLFEPAVLDVPQGGRASGELRVVAATAGEYTIALEPDPGLRVEPSTSTLNLRANESRTIALTVFAETAPAGTRGVVQASLNSGAWDLLDVRVVPSAPTLEDAIPPTEGLADPPTRTASGPVPVAAWGFAAVGVAGLAFLALDRRRAWIATLLYTRLLPREVEEHPARRRIVDAVRQEPGLTMAAVQRKTGLANGALAYHARVLQGARRIVLTKDATGRRAYPIEVARPPLARATGESILERLHHEGPMPTSALRAHMGISRQALHKQLRKLAALGRVRVRPTDEGGLVEAVSPVPRRPPRDGAGAAPSPPTSGDQRRAP